MSVFPMTYVELFAGVGGLSMGLEAAGFRPIAHCEVNEHARAVLRRHWPMTRLDGDVREIDGAWYRGVTLVSGGSPCQDLSIGGQRAGLKGERSSLFYEQVRVWNESRAPLFLWENVKGALTSNKGKDFAAVLSAITGATIDVPRTGRNGTGKARWLSAGMASGPAGVACWRVLDLQYFGPPQRRTRVFVVASRTPRVRPEVVLDLLSGCQGHPDPRRAQKQSVAAATRSGTGGSSEVAGPLGSVTGGFRTTDLDGVGAYVVDPVSFKPSHYTRGKDGAPSDIMPPLTADADKGDQDPLLAVPIGFNWQNGGGYAEANDGLGITEDGTGPLSRSQVMAVAQPVRVFNRRGGFGWSESVELSPTLQSQGGTHQGGPDYLPLVGVDLGPTLTSRDYKGPGGANNGEVNTLVFPQGVVRRITCKEGERLMGWPDDWTRYGVYEDGQQKEISNTQRYRLIGNGVGAPQVRWIAERLAQQLREDGE